MTKKPLLNIAVITLLPEMFHALQYGINQRTLDEDLLKLHLFNPRDYSHDRHRRVDDRPYGGGPGMVLQYQPLRDAIEAAKAAIGQVPVYYLSPQGQPLTQVVFKANTELDCILLCGRYEGIDERVIDTLVDAEWSLGDFVLSGGEIPAMAYIDGIIRLLPGALGNKVSHQEDSFSKDGFDHPHYTRPEIIDGKRVPSVLLEGDHAAIQKWRQQQAKAKTTKIRPDLLKKDDNPHKKVDN